MTEQETTTQARIKTILTTHKVVLFMKGTPDFPQCGFSAKTVAMLRQSGCDLFHSVNVLEDSAIREGIKQYANWPTIPQLYINGEFCGGCDVMTEMVANGELVEILK